MDFPAVDVLALIRQLQGMARVELPVREGQLLLAFLGQDLEALLEAKTPQGARLRFSEGTVVSAEGQVPFPEGTTLRLRVSPGSDGAGVRLQMLEARPAVTPTILLPLVQGEAFPLLQRLATPEAPPELATLQRLLRALSPPEPTPEPSVQGPPLLREGIRQLEPSIREALTRLLGLPAQAPEPVLLERLAGLFRGEAPRSAPRSPSPQVPPSQVPISVLAPAPVPALGPVPLPEAALRARLLEWIDAQPDLPIAFREPLLRLLRPPKDRALPLLREGGRPTHAPPVDEEAQPLLRAERSAVEARGPGLESVRSSGLSTPNPPAATLEAWIREGVKVLGDPRVSPQEAPFHVVQAREQTAFFELPLPTGSAQTLQLWVEWQEEGEASERPAGEAPIRMLFGTRFTGLGETRVGLAATPGRLEVRIWTERPERVEPELEAMGQELLDTGVIPDLRVMPLDPSAPTVRALVSGQGWDGMV